MSFVLSAQYQTQLQESICLDQFSALCHGSHVVPTQANILFKFKAMHLTFALIQFVEYVGRVRYLQLLCLWTAY